MNSMAVLNTYARARDTASDSMPIEHYLYRSLTRHLADYCVADMADMHELGAHLYLELMATAGLYGHSIESEEIRAHSLGKDDWWVLLTHNIGDGVTLKRMLSNLKFWLGDSVVDLANKKLEALCVAS